MYSAGRLLEPQARARVRHPRASVSAGPRDVARTQEGAARLGRGARRVSFSRTTTTATIVTKAGRSPRCRAWTRNGRVIYIGSFNKILFPGLRIAYAIVPEALVGAFVDAKHVADGHTALLTQGVLAAFIHDGHLARHLRKTRAIYDERRLAFLEEAKILADVVDFGPRAAACTSRASSRTVARSAWMIAPSRRNARAPASRCTPCPSTAQRTAADWCLASLSRRAPPHDLVSDRAACDRFHRRSGFMSDSPFMARALELAREAERAGEVPVGAVIVKDDAIVGEGWNRPISTNDPTAHAEIVAMRAAAQKLGTYRLLDTTLYVTLEPCPMCAGAMVHARVKRLVYAATDPRAGAAGTIFNIVQHPSFNHRLECEAGLMGEECGTMLRAFFQGRR